MTDAPQQQLMEDVQPIEVVFEGENEEVVIIHVECYCDVFETMDIRLEPHEF
jgi:hypothetical protein